MTLPKVLSRHMSDRVYCSGAISCHAAIADSRECTHVIVAGRDCIINILTLHYKPCNKLGDNTVEFPMAVDAMSIRVQSFGPDEEPRFLEAVQDAVIAASVNHPDTHDESGFIILRPKLLTACGSRYRNGEAQDASIDITMPRLMRLLTSRRSKDSVKNFCTPTKVDTIQPGTSWNVDADRSCRHLKLVDAICTIFMLADDNVNINRSRSITMYAGIDNDTEYKQATELLKLLNGYGAGLSPMQARYIIWLMERETIQSRYSEAYRNNDYYMSWDDE